VAALHGFGFAHLGVNSPDEGAGRALAGDFERLFGLSGREGTSSIFAGDCLEITKRPFPGVHGHLAIRCNQVERAVAHFRAAGIAVRPDTAKTARGRLQAIYLDLELGGFAVHLLQA
jgi:2-dehydro-3-deoxyphosphogluconate aldolase/(4S)-4-hydroxy-2-oxoglutarate aldolase